MDDTFIGDRAPKPRNHCMKIVRSAEKVAGPGLGSVELADQHRCVDHNTAPQHKHAGKRKSWSLFFLLLLLMAVTGTTATIVIV